MYTHNIGLHFMLFAVTVDRYMYNIAKALKIDLAVIDWKLISSTTLMMRVMLHACTTDMVHDLSADMDAVSV